MSAPLNALQFRQLLDQYGKLEGCQRAGYTITTEAQAEARIYTYVMRLLHSGNYLGAAVVLWGDTVFNPRPACVQSVWRALRESFKLLIQGAGSLGKSYTAAAYVLLDWWADPEFTSFKIISTTKGHAKGATFSTMVRLFGSTIVKMPGEVSATYIGLDPKEQKSGIAVLAIPPGDDGKGRLQGFHPDPRPKPHPVYGTSSRVRAFLDEAEEIPIGVWEGVDNILLSASGNDTIKVFCSYNPKDPTSKTAQNAEPEDGGWDAFDLETGVRGKNIWVSKNGWTVLRLDGKQAENVKQKKLVHAGFLTYQGYRALELKDGGNSMSFYTFGRGAYPPEGSVGIIVSAKVLREARGEFIWVGGAVNCAGFDTAVDGRDAAGLSVGKKGLASAFRRPDGTVIKFNRNRQVAIIEQYYECKKGGTKIVGDDLMHKCIALGIAPAHLCMDATGNGAAVHAYLCAEWGEVQGVDFRKPATNKKILEEDMRTPDELYKGIVTEVWFAMARFLEFGYGAISPNCRQHPMEAEILGRRCILDAGKLLKVEDKDDYKKRLGHSPDAGDSATLFFHGVRMRDHMMGSMQVTPRPKKPAPKVSHDIGEPEWIEEAHIV